MNDQNKTIEQKFQKKTQLEHILLRPDSYVGSIEHENKELWILAEDGQKFIEKEIDFVPAFYKIFDEIIVNAADNFQRRDEGKIMDTMKVLIDQEAKMISVWNNGQGIPVVIHKEHRVYVPEMIFGQLLTGSNYDDNEQKVVGGRNGYGAKLTNIFSTKFIIECNDEDHGAYYKQEWRKNMNERTEPLIQQNKKGGAFTCVTFFPDLKRFKMEGLSDDIVGLLKKRVYDMAGIFNNQLKVYLNGEQIKIKSFSQYINMYLPDIDEQLKVYDKDMKTDRWEILLTFSDGQFKQVSFVNAICTSKGGKHVDYITDKIVESIQQQIQKKNKDLDIKPHQIRSHMFIFVNSLIVNPSFDSQTKETLTTKASQFGSKPEVTEKFIKQVLKTGIVEQIVSQARARENSKLQKTLKGGKKARILGIPKLDDANDAGTARSENCTLILTEGDSAKALAMAGIEIVGRDTYGVFPLKGKLLNVREAPKKQIMDNQEVQNLCKIMGLDPAKPNYENTKSLRYGSIMIMADQDTDGSHIKGLLINFIHYFWPSLFRMNGFLKEFVTPIIKATKGNESHSFFTLQDFKNFANQVGNRLKTYKVKYYKGLGTSTDKEAKEYFSNVQNHQIRFIYEDEVDSEKIELGFSRKKIQDRKDWLAIYDPDIFVDYNIKHLRFKDFVDKELIHFSNFDNLRSIPSIVDGLKPGQRKILFACFKRNLKSEIKVAQLQGYVAEHSAYHHGEQSLAATIIGMAQNFVGANNINLLQPIGQFGTRNQGGKEHASSRYIFTNLSPITRILFPEPDDHCLKYKEDDSQIVEPEWYVPIIPLCLVNGSEGIGTGWSTNIPNYDHREIVQLIRDRLEDKPFRQIHPWYKGFQGVIEQSDKGGYIVKGKWEVDEDSETVRITELPIGKWTKEYKKYLEEMVNPSKDESPDLDDIREYHTNNRVDFLVQCIRGKLRSWDIEKKFRLSTTIQTTNMVLFDKEYKLKRYQGTEEILEYFYNIRLEFYEKRKIYLVSKLQRDLDLLSNKMKFINYVNSGQIELRNVKRKALVQKLIQLEFTPMSKITKIKSTKIQAFDEKKKENSELNKIEGNEEEYIENEENLQEDAEEIQANEFNYLLSMPIYSLTEEKAEQLKKQVQEKNQELIVQQKKDIKDLWREDLDLFIKVIDDIEEQEEKERLSTKGIMQNGKQRRNKQEKVKQQVKNQNDKENAKQKQNQMNNQQNSLDNNLTKDATIEKNLKQGPKNQQTGRKNKEVNIQKEQNQTTLIERLQMKFGKDKVNENILEITKRKPQDQKDDIDMNNKRKKTNKTILDSDEEPDLSYIQPSELINKQQKQQNVNKEQNQNQNQMEQIKKRNILKIIDDSSESQALNLKAGKNRKKKIINSSDDDFIVDDQDSDYE